MLKVLCCRPCVLMVWPSRGPSRNSNGQYGACTNDATPRSQDVVSEQKPLWVACLGSPTPHGSGAILRPSEIIPPSSRSRASLLKEREREEKRRAGVGSFLCDRSVAIVDVGVGVRTGQQGVLRMLSGEGEELGSLRCYDILR